MLTSNDIFYQHISFYSGFFGLFLCFFICTTIADGFGQKDTYYFPSFLLFLLCLMLTSLCLRGLGFALLGVGADWLGFGIYLMTFFFGAYIPWVIGYG